MTKSHKAKQSDTLPSIANQHGFRNWKGIYDSEENNAKSLKELRPNPNVLKAGDTIVIPDKEIKQEAGDTDTRHRFRRKQSPVWLRIYLKGIYDGPFKNKKFKLEMGALTIEDETNGEGLIEQKISPNLKDCTLYFDDWVYHLKIGSLDPFDCNRGWQSRLINLGYAPELEEIITIKEIDEQNARIKAAIEEFQFDHSLKVDGIMGPKTRQKLKEVYGC